MPGDIIRFRCNCGLQGVAGPGITELNWDASSENVMAYNPEYATIDTISREEAEDRNLNIYRNPFLDDPLGFTKVVKDCLCPRCNKKTLIFEKFGNWD